MNRNVDLRAIAERADLRAIIERTHVIDRAKKVFCLWHDNQKTPSMQLYATAHKGWKLKCHACGQQADALDWVMKVESVTVMEAARIIAPGAFGLDDRPGSIRTQRVDAPHPAPARPRVEPPEPWRDAQWQEEADRIVTIGERKLWEPEGRDARRWLKARGINRQTMRQFRLGYLNHDVYSCHPIRATADAERPAGRKLWAPRGIVIPWCAPGADYHDDPEAPFTGPRWCGVNVRRLGEFNEETGTFDPPPARGEEGKCLMLKGSRPGHGYPYPDLPPTLAGPPALIVEGEWDALLAHQEAGHLVHVITTGGAGTPPKPSALAFLSQCPLWLLAFDEDKAGCKATSAWDKLNRDKVGLTYLPEGKDLTDLRNAGESVAEWVRDQLRQLSAP